jgi:hypothetical protein
MEEIIKMKKFKMMTDKDYQPDPLWSKCGLWKERGEGQICGKMRRPTVSGCCLKVPCGFDQYRYCKPTPAKAYNERAKKVNDFIDEVEKEYEKNWEIEKRWGRVGF